MIILSTYTLSLELVILIVAVVGNLLLTSLVVRNNPKNATNIIFAGLSIASALWLIAAYVIRLPEFTDKLLLARLGIFFAAPMSTFFFLLAHTMPKAKIQLPAWLFNLIIIVTVAMMGLNVSPFAFTRVDLSTGAINPTPGWGFIPFAFLSTLFSFLAIYYLVKKIKREDTVVRAQLKTVLVGILLMLTLIILTILIPILVFQSGVFVPLTPIYTLIFLSLTAYAIVKQQLFNLKIIATEALTVIILLVLFAKIFSAESVAARAVDIVVFVFMVIFGELLIRSVRREVAQREHIEKLAKALAVSNKKLGVANQKLTELSRQKTEFVSIASHQLRAPLTAIKGYSSMVLEGSFGEISDKVRGAVERVFESSQRLVNVIEDFLDITRIELGKMKYDLTDFAFNEMVRKLVEDVRPGIVKKGLLISYEAAPGQTYTVAGDQGKLSQVVTNVIDNAVKYTPKGYLKVIVSRVGDTVRLAVSDTGIGIAAETLPKLFEKFVRADKAGETNIVGTGLGLYVAKQIVEAHGGKIWAESAGLGHGSTFIVELKGK